jgi:polar amino acid transport system permease protein
VSVRASERRPTPEAHAVLAAVEVAPHGLRLSWRHGAALAAFFVLSVAVAQAQGGAAKPGVMETLIHWTPLLAKGFVFNLAISFLSMALGTALGVFLGIGQLARGRGTARASTWVTHFFRNAPWLVLLFFAMLLLPFALRLGPLAIPFPDWVKAIVGLALPVMANVSEIVRGGVQSIPGTQWEAAAALAFTRAQAYRMIILPQAIKRMLPPWMNLYAILTMATVLASIVGVNEVMTLTKNVLNAESRPELLIPFYGYVLLWFFIYCYPIALWTVHLERRYAVQT